MNLEEKRKYMKFYYIKNPWIKTFSRIQQRCNYKYNNNYSRYGAKGIRNFLTVQELKYMWFRDKANEMKHPSIDRIDSRNDYTLDNCRYLELKDNLRRPRMNKKTHCKRGHEYNESNIIRYSCLENGRKRPRIECRLCRKITRSLICF